MRLLLAFIAVIALADRTQAQILAIRSGEHDGFSRIVMRIPEGVGWSLDQSDGEAELAVDIPDVRFDTTRVFDRIPRSRLRGLNQAAPGAPLELQLGCGCEVIGFVQSGILLVIDIRDRPDPAEPVWARNRPLPSIPYRFRPEITAVQPSRRTEAGHPSGASAGSGDDDERLPIAPPSPPSADRIGGKDIGDPEARLLAQIRRAAEQGLVSPRAPLPGSASEDRSSIRPADTRRVLPSASVIATTVIDRDLAVIGAETVPAGAEEIPGCVPSDRLAIGSWGDGRPFAAQIGAWRSSLFGEFDRINAADVLGLARTYLYFGFGAEAARALTLIPEASEDTEILRGLADLVEDASLSGPNPFSGQQSCDGDVALWAFLAEPERNEAVNTKAVLRAFARLPAKLRTHLGAELSRSFVLAGDEFAARVILGAAGRAAPETDPALRLVKAAINERSGDAEAAVREMSRLAVSGSEIAPLALVELVAIRWRERKSLPPDLLELTAAYAMEYRSSELGPDLRRAHTLALALTGRFAEAFAQLRALAADDGQEARSRAWPPLAALLTERANDVTFLKYAMSADDGPGQTMPISLGEAMAQRVLDLGFPDAARQILNRLPDAGLSPRQRILRAKAAIAERNPRQAMAALSGLRGREAERVRAAAMWQKGDYRGAGDALLAAEDPETAARGYWMSGELDAITQPGEARYGQAAQVTSRLKRRRKGYSLPPLAASRALIGDSMATRNDISELLGIVEIGPPDEQ